MPKDPKELGLSQADLEDLTDEEREGLLDDTVADEGELDEAEAPELVADQAANEGKKPDADPAKTADEEQQAETGTDAGEGEGGTAATSEEEPEPEPERTARPAPKADRDFAQEIQTLESQQDELSKKFDEGDLTAAEYNTQLRELNRKISGVEKEQIKFELRAEDAQSTYTGVTVPAFLKDHREYQVGKPRYNALDIEVRRLQDEAIEKGEDPFAKSILEAAHAAVEADFGPAPAAKKDANKGTGTGLGGKTGKPGKAREIPPALGQVPAADNTDDIDGGRYAYLDRLSETNPQAFEVALNKLSDADREAYLSQ